MKTGIFLLVLAAAGAGILKQQKKGPFKKQEE